MTTQFRRSFPANVYKPLWYIHRILLFHNQDILVVMIVINVSSFKFSRKFSVIQFSHQVRLYKLRKELNTIIYTGDQNELTYCIYTAGMVWVKMTSSLYQSLCNSGMLGSNREIMVCDKLGWGDLRRSRERYKQ